MKHHILFLLRRHHFCFVFIFPFIRTAIFIWRQRFFFGSKMRKEKIYFFTSFLHSLLFGSLKSFCLQSRWCWYTVNKCFQLDFFFLFFFIFILFSFVRHYTYIHLSFTRRGHEFFSSFLVVSKLSTQHPAIAIYTDSSPCTRSFFFSLIRNWCHT